MTEFDESGGSAAMANLSVGLSDLGSVNLSGRLETAGYGSIESNVMDRRMDDLYQMNFSTSLDLGRFLPEKAKIQLPAYFSYTNETLTPKYNPLDQDILLDEALDVYTRQEDRDTLLMQSQTVSTTKSFNISSARVNIKSKKPQFYDPANVTFTYAYSENNQHNPEVKEKLEELGIKVMIERSSYEKHPLGRLEWIKLFGVLFGREQQAKAFFDAQAAHIEPILEKEKTGLSVAFFAVASDGTITVRKPNDYVSSMIELAGGTYSLNGYVPEEENALSTLKMQMEDFYAAEKDADILIYNGTIEGELTSIDELVQKNSLFADFKAVKTGQVYTTGSNFYQQTSGTCDFIEDLNIDRNRNAGKTPSIGFMCGFLKVNDI
jgi:hypothetical protein